MSDNVKPQAEARMLPVLVKCKVCNDVTYVVILQCCVVPCPCCSENPYAWNKPKQSFQPNPAD